MPEDRYLNSCFVRKPLRGRQRTTWGKVIDYTFLSLGLDKCEWLEDIESDVEECISERECKRDLIIKLNWLRIKRLAKYLEFKKILA